MSHKANEVFELFCEHKGLQFKPITDGPVTLSFCGLPVTFSLLSGNLVLSSMPGVAFTGALRHNANIKSNLGSFFCEIDGEVALLKVCSYYHTLYTFEKHVSGFVTYLESFNEPSSN